MIIKAINNQSLFDISIQVTGSALHALLIAKENNISPTIPLLPGQEIKIPEDLEEEQIVLDYYQSNIIEPSTALTELEKQEIEGCEGIGCWAIGLDFIIN